MFQIQHAGKRWPWCNMPVNLGDNRCRCRRRSICFVWFMSAELRAPHNRIFLCAISSAYNEAARIMWGNHLIPRLNLKSVQLWKKRPFFFWRTLKVPIQQIKCKHLIAIIITFKIIKWFSWCCSYGQCAVNEATSPGGRLRYYSQAQCTVVYRIRLPPRVALLIVFTSFGKLMFTDV